MIEPISPNSLQRRLKRHVLKAPQHYLAVTSPGLEPILRRELETFPSLDILGEVPGGIELTGPIDLMYLLNLHVRCMSRLLLRIGEVRALNSPALFNGTRRLRWEEFVGFNPSISFRISTRKSALNQPAKIRKVLHDAVTERLTIHGLAPALVEKGGSIQFVAHNWRDRCTLSIDVTGAPLHQRGYRSHISGAPIRESLAAGLLLAVGFAPQTYTYVLDPFCGSGTFLMEAHLMANRLPPGATRTFAFERAPFFQARKWENLKRRAQTKHVSAESPVLEGYDIDPIAIETAKEIARRLPQSHPGSMRFEMRNTLEADLAEGVQHDDRCLLISNLPYGKRIMNPAEGNHLFESFVEKINRECVGWTVGVVIPRQWNTVRLALDKKQEINFSNGGLPVRFLFGRVRPN